jgi:hypothetical protein
VYGPNEMTAWNDLVGGKAGRMPWPEHFARTRQFVGRLPIFTVHDPLPATSPTKR